MQVILQMTNLPPGSPIGPVFNIVLTPAGVANPAQVNLSQLLSPGGALVSIPDDTTTISVQSTGLCTNSQDVEVPCFNPFEYLFTLFFESVQNPTVQDFESFLSNDVITINGCNVCNKECEDYVFSNIDTYLMYVEASQNDNCCIKLISSIESYLKYAEAIGGTPVP